MELRPLTAPPYRLPDGAMPWGPPAPGEVPPSAPTPEQPRRHRGRAFAIAGAVVVAALLGGYLVASALDDGSDSATPTDDSTLSSSLGGSESASADLRGTEWSNPTAFDGGVMLTSGFAQSTAYDDDGQRIRSFDAAMFPDSVGGFHGYDAAQHEYVYWTPTDALQRTEVNADPTALRAYSDAAQVAEVIGDRVTVYDLDSGRQSWSGTFAADATTAIWVGGSIAVVDVSHQLEIVAEGSSSPAVVNGSSTLRAVLDVVTFGGDRDDTQVLAVDTDGRLHAFDATDGSERWQLDMSADHVSSLDAYLLGDLLWVDGTLVRAADGSEVWVQPAEYKSCDVVTPDLLQCAGDDDTADLVRVADPDADPVRLHGYVAAVDAGVAYLVDDDTIEAVTIATGDDVWTEPASSSDGWSYALGLTDGQILVADGAARLVALDRSTGHVDRDFDADVDDVTIVEIGDGVAYVISTDAEAGRSALHVIR